MSRVPSLLTLALAAACGQDAPPPPDDPSTITDSAGVRVVDLAALEVPAGLAVKCWGPDRVVGIVRDELDREEIHRYRILTGAGPGTRAGRGQSPPSTGPRSVNDLAATDVSLL